MMDQPKRYGQWSGNPAGQAEDHTRCIESVTGNRQWIPRQCSRKRGHGPDGKYCKQHAANRAEMEELNKKYGIT